MTADHEKVPATSALEPAQEEAQRTEQLIYRIAELEYEQRSSREQISRLSSDKSRIEAALKKLKEEREQMAADMEAALQSRLSKMLQTKEQEQQALRDKIAQYQAETEQQMAKLRRERDEALALMQTNHNSSAIGKTRLSNQWFLPIAAVTLLLILVSLVGLYAFFALR